MKQNDLPLDCSPYNETSMRAAYNASALPELGYPFERAMRDDAMKRCLANVSDALRPNPVPGDFEIPESIRKRQCSRCEHRAMPDSDLCYVCHGREVVPQPWKCD